MSNRHDQILLVDSAAEMAAEAAALRPRVEAELMATLRPLGPGGKLWIAVLLSLSLWGIIGYVLQCTYGLGVTAMRNYVSWGLYIATFVFYIGISHVGALMSAILRLTKAEWRRPITRMAEAITFASLFFGGLMPMIDMGRPDRLHYLFLHGRLQSPILWDILCIATYFAGSTIFLFVPMIPDIAMLRDRLPNQRPWRRRLYSALSLGWQGTDKQRHRLERCMRVMTAVILPVAISVHTVVSWIFVMTLRPGWSSTIFGPYFVSGALMSGCAAVIVAMAAFRRAYHLERYITPVHFGKLALLLFVLTMIYLYFNVNEYWTAAYKMESAEGHLLRDLFFGHYAALYWVTQIGGILLPLLMLAIPRIRSSIPLVITACLMIVVFAWVKRYIIVVPTMMHPYLPLQDVPAAWSNYFPSLVEWSITLGSFAGFLLLYTVFSRLFPIISVWETMEGIEEAGARAVGVDLSSELSTNAPEGVAL
jgi:molybdopterin-containing oxidoreductase family membrane subunit